MNVRVPQPGITVSATKEVQVLTSVMLIDRIPVDYADLKNSQRAPDRPRHFGHAENVWSCLCQMLCRQWRGKRRSQPGEKRLTVPMTTTINAMVSVMTVSFVTRCMRSSIGSCAPHPGSLPAPSLTLPPHCGEGGLE